MVQIQQTSEWWSIFGSEHGDPAPPQLPGGFDEAIPTMMIVQHKRPTFKRPFAPVQRFRVAPLARAASPAGSTASSMHLGVSTADYSQKSKASAWEESPSPSAMDRQ